MLSTLIGAFSLYVAAELAARARIRRRREYFVLPPGLRLRLRVDRDIVPGLEPDARVDINRDGERGDDVPPGPGLYRVLVAGGSQAECYLLDQPTSWPGVLQGTLGAPDGLRRLGAARVHVGSIARSGVGAEALDLILERVLPRYPRLQLIVLLVGATDVLRWLELGTPSVLPPVRTSDVFRCHPDVAFGWKPSRLAAVELARRSARRWLRPIDRHDHAVRWIGAARQMRANAAELRATTPDPAPMLDHFAVHLARALTRARARADRVLLVRQPWFETPYTPEEAAQMWHGAAGQVWREHVDTFYSAEVCSRLMSLVDARAAEVAARSGVEQLHLMPVLERGLGTFYDAFHLTPAGARAMAASIADAVLANAAARRPASIEEHRAPARPAAPVLVPGEVEHEPCADSRAS